MKRLIRAFGPKIQFETRPCIETHPIESFVKRGGIEPPEAKTVGAERAGEHDLQTVRSIGEVVERLGVGVVGVGMIELRDDPPRTTGSNGPGAFRRRIDGFDLNAIRGLGHERFKARALKRGFSGSAPIGLGVGGKKVRDRAQRRPPLDELGKPGNRCGDFADDLVARGFPGIGEDFLSDRLDLLHPEAQAQQFRAERHQPAPAHRPARHAHQTFQTSRPCPRPRSVCSKR